MPTTDTGVASSVDAGNLVDLAPVESGCEPKLVITSS